MTVVVCFLVTCAYVFDVGVHIFSSTSRRACGYDMFDVALSVHISFSFFQVGQSLEETLCSVELQLRHFVGLEQDHVVHHRTCGTWRLCCRI